MRLKTQLEFSTVTKLVLNDENKWAAHKWSVDAHYTLLFSSLDVHHSSSESCMQYDTRWHGAYLSRAKHVLGPMLDHPDTASDLCRWNIT